MENQLVLSTKKVSYHIPANDWKNVSLKRSLRALGFSDEETRFRPSVKSILDCWIGEEKTLLELVKAKWKKLVVIFHEASETADVEQWKNVNSLYSAIVKKIALGIRKRKTPETVEYNCFICHKPVTKIVKSWTQRNSKVCRNPECKKKYHNYRVRRYRQLCTPNLTRTCAGPECSNRFITKNSRRKYCCKRCAANRNKLVESIAITTGKRIKKKVKWADKVAKMTPEQIQADKLRRAELKAIRISKMTSEELAALRKRRAAYAQQWRRKMTPEERSAYTKRYYKSRVQQIAEKREQWKNKPWMFETWMQQRGYPLEQAA
jgi:hypothetical protein